MLNVLMSSSDKSLLIVQKEDCCWLGTYFFIFILESEMKSG